MRRALPLLFLAACLPDTDGFGAGEASDGGAVRDGASTGDASAGEDGGADDGGGVDARVPPGVDGGRPPGPDGGPPGDSGAGGGELGPGKCQPWPLACLDASGDDVLEIPTEGSIAAVASALPGTTIQLRGVTVGGQVRLPPYVTVHGCEGARLSRSGTLWPSNGGGAVIEGLEIAGTVVFSVSGTYLLRDNHFTGRTDTSAAVEIRASEPYTAADVTVTVERNRFEGIPRAISIRTRYDVVDNRVRPTIRNNLFSGVAGPIDISEGGLTGYVSDGRIEHNTFHDFETAVRMFDQDRPIVLDANLFVGGQTGVSSTTFFNGAGNMASDVDVPSNVPPLGGSIAAIPGPLVNAAEGDFRPRPGSLAIDAVSSAGLADDLEGCPRPVAFSGGAARSDVGALEAQPL